MEFSSVDDFLRKTASAKRDKRSVIDDELAPFIEDPATIGVPPTLVDALEKLLHLYGDETFRQVALFCVGKWHRTHCEILQQHITNAGMSEALLTMGDISKLSTTLQLLEQVGSFGGDDSWRKMLREMVGQAVLENIEERGISPETFFSQES